MTHPDQIPDLQAALRALWPDRPVVYFTKDSALAAEKGTGPQLTDDERGQLTRVAELLREAKADAEDAWRNVHEMQRELDSLQRLLEKPAPVSTGDAALDRQIDKAAHEAGLQHLYEEASAAVARAIGLARHIGYRQAGVEAEDNERERSEKES